MPLVSAGIWLDENADGRPLQPRRTRLVEGYADPAPPTGASPWFDSSQPRATPPRRGFRPAPEQSDDERNEWVGVAEALAWQAQPPTALFTPPRRLFEPVTFPLGSADVPALNWDAPLTPPLPARGRRLGEQLGLVLDAGPDMQLQGWDAPQARLAAGPARRLPVGGADLPGPSTADLPLLSAALTTQPAPIAAPPRRRPIEPAGVSLAWFLNDLPQYIAGLGQPERPIARPAPRVSEQAALPPLAFTFDVLAWAVVLTPPLETRARTRRAPIVEVAGLAPPLPDALTWNAALVEIEQPPRSRRWLPADAADSAPPAWATIAADTALGWGAWEVPQPIAPRQRRAPTPAAAGSLLIDLADQLDVPWVETNSDRPTRRPSWRAVEQWAAPDWIEAGLIAVAGPYVCLAGALYVAGAVDGQVESTS